MTLDEIFEKYSDDKDGFYRKSYVDRLKKHRPDLTEEYIIEKSPKYPVDWLKGLKAWGNQESRDLGFFISKGMIEDANADDWELYEEK